MAHFTSAGCGLGGPASAVMQDALVDARISLASVLRVICYSLSSSSAAEI